MRPALGPEPERAGQRVGFENGLDVPPPIRWGVPDGLRLQALHRRRRFHGLRPEFPGSALPVARPRPGPLRRCRLRLMLWTAQSLPLKGFRGRASPPDVSLRRRQPATGPPGSYPDRTPTGLRRRACRCRLRPRCPGQPIAGRPDRRYASISNSGGRRTHMAFGIRSLTARAGVIVVVAGMSVVTVTTSSASVGHLRGTTTTAVGHDGPRTITPQTDGNIAGRPVQAEIPGTLAVSDVTAAHGSDTHQAAQPSTMPVPGASTAAGTALFTSGHEPDPQESVSSGNGVASSNPIASGDAVASPGPMATGIVVSPGDSGIGADPPSGRVGPQVGPIGDTVSPRPGGDGKTSCAGSHSGCVIGASSAAG